MNILVITEVSYARKKVIEIQDFAERLAGRGHNVSIIDFDGNSGAVEIEKYKNYNNNEYKNIHISRTGIAEVKLETTPFIDFPIFKYIDGRWNFKKILINKLINERIDIIFLYSVFISGTQAIKIGKKYHIPVVFRAIDIYHKIRKNIFVMPFLYFGEKYIYKNAAHVSATNDKMKDYIIKMSNNKANSVQTLTHGVDHNFFKPIPRDPQLCEKYNISSDDKVVLFLGTTYLFSGLDIIIIKFNELVKLVPNVKLVIVGAGPLDDTLKNLTATNKYSNKIILTGVQPYYEVPMFLSLADVTINPFQINDITRDIVPIKILQYLACGKPVISAPIQDIVKLFPEPNCGVRYCDINETKNFINEIAKLLNDEAAAKIASEQGLDFVREYFSVESRILELEQTFIKIINENKNIY